MRRLHNYKKTAFLLSLVTAIAAAGTIGCSKKEDDPMTNHEGGNCGFEVVSDYNTMILNCRSSSYATCDSSINSFLDKYPGINCNAEKSDPNSVYNQVITITEDYIRNLQSLLTSSGNTSSTSAYSVPSSYIPTPSVNYKNGEACSDVVISDFNRNISNNCQAAIDFKSTNTKEYTACRDGIDRFLAKYPGVFCKKIISETSETSYTKEEDLLVVKKAVSEVILLLEMLEKSSDTADQGLEI